MDVTGVPFVDSCVKIFRGCTFEVQALQIFPVGYFVEFFEFGYDVYFL